MAFKLFYTDYTQDQHVRSDEAKPADVQQIIDCMNTRLHEEDNFIGLVDDKEVMLQFMVEEGGSLTVDVPVHDRRGSFAKSADLEACIDIVQSLGNTIDINKIAGLEFKPWGR